MTTTRTAVDHIKIKGRSKMERIWSTRVTKGPIERDVKRRCSGAEDCIQWLVHPYVVRQKIRAIIADQVGGTGRGIMYRHRQRVSVHVVVCFSRSGGG